MNMETNASAACPQCEAQKALRNAAALSPEKLIALADELNAESGADASIAPVSVQKQRRECCAACESLAGGAMCSWCGCYIALRARGTKAVCPYPGNDKWSAL